MSKGSQLAKYAFISRVKASENLIAFIVFISLFIFVFKESFLEATRLSLGLLFINYLLTSLITLLQLRTALKEIPSNHMFVGHNKSNISVYQVIIGYFNKNNEFVIFKGHLTDYALKMLDAMHSPVEDIDLNFDNVRIKLTYISIKQESC